MSNTSLRRSLSCSISLVPSVYLSPLGPPVRFLSPSFYLGSISICLPVSLSLSPPPPRSRRQEKNPSSSVSPFCTAPSTCSLEGRRSGRVNERDAAIGDDDGDDDDTATATSPMARTTRDVIRRKRKKKRKRLPAARARARERDDPASSYARDSVWATTEERICAVPAQAFVPVLTRHGATVDHPFRRGRKRWIRGDTRPTRIKHTHARARASTRLYSDILRYTPIYCDTRHGGSPSDITILENIDIIFSFLLAFVSSHRCLRADTTGDIDILLEHCAINILRQSYLFFLLFCLFRMTTYLSQIVRCNL